LKPRTLNQALERARTVPGTGLRLLDRHERPSFHAWSEIDTAARRVCAALQARGVARGERVALVLPTGAEFFSAFFGTLLAGAVPAPLYPPVRLGRLEEYHARTARMMEAAGARIVLTDKRVRRLLGEAVARARPPLGLATVDALAAGARAEDAAPVDVGPDALGLVQFSSGTTVAPKPVALSHGAILAQVHALNACWPDADGVVQSGLSWLPLYHDMGLIGCVFPALERPAVLTLLAPEVFVARPAAWLRALSRWQATISPAPNFAYGLCVARVKDAEIEGIDLGHWRFALCGAEAVAPSVLRAFQRRFAAYGLRPEALSPVYGLAEAALAVTFSDLGRPFTSTRFDEAALAEKGEARALPDASEGPDGAEGGATDAAPSGRELVSLGRPLAGFDVRIRGESGAAQPEGVVGRVHVRGPSLMTAYLGQPEATARALRDGWLDTGDLGFLHRGELHLTGRAKDVLIVRGANHAPEELEHAVDAVPGVRTGCSAAVCHAPVGADREQLVLFVERTPEARGAVLEALPGACKQAVLAAAGLELDAVLVLAPGTLPRTSSGKIRRQEALRQHLAGALAPPDRVSLLGMLGAMHRSQRALRRLRRGSDPAGA